MIDQDTSQTRGTLQDASGTSKTRRALDPALGAPVPGPRGLGSQD